MMTKRAKVGSRSLKPRAWAAGGRRGNVADSASRRSTTLPTMSDNTLIKSAELIVQGVVTRVDYRMSGMRFDRLRAAAAHVRDIPHRQDSQGTDQRPIQPVHAAAHRRLESQGGPFHASGRVS